MKLALCSNQHLWNSFDLMVQLKSAFYCILLNRIKTGCCLFVGLCPDKFISSSAVLDGSLQIFFSFCFALILLISQWKVQRLRKREIIDITFECHWKDTNFNFVMLDLMLNYLFCLFSFTALQGRITQLLQYSRKVIFLQNTFVHYRHRH